MKHSIETIIKSIASLLLKLMSGRELPSPKHRIKAHYIEVGDDWFEVSGIKGVRIDHVANTNSMEPFIDVKHNIISTTNVDYQRLIVGDVIMWETVRNLNNRPVRVWIIHQICKLGMDKEGWYCKTKGVNNTFADPYKIREKSIRALVLGVLW